MHFEAVLSCQEVQKEARRRLPSIFSASCDADLKLLNRCYAPNIFAWDRCPVGVEDDVDDLQLRIAYRLRSRAEALQRADLAQLRQMQRQEMSDADEFMQGFDASHAVQRQGPLPRASAGTPKARQGSVDVDSGGRSPRPSGGPLPRPFEPFRRPFRALQCFRKVATRARSAAQKRGGLYSL